MGGSLGHKRCGKELKTLGWLEVLQKEGWDVGGSYKSCAWALGVWGGQRILQSGGRQGDSTAKKWGCCSAGRAGM